MRVVISIETERVRDKTKNERKYSKRKRDRQNEGRVIEKRERVDRGRGQ